MAYGPMTITHACRQTDNTNIIKILIEKNNKLSYTIIIIIIILNTLRAFILLFCIISY